MHYLLHRQKALEDAMSHIDITQPITLYRRAAALEGEAAQLRAAGNRKLAGLKNVAALQYRDAGDAIAHARRLEAQIAGAEAAA
jgi:hypothetical protein